MGVVRDFFHTMVDALCDLFKKAWDSIVKLVKAAVRFVGNAADFFKSLYKKSWDALMNGAKRLYVFWFGDKSDAVSDGERALIDILDTILIEAFDDPDFEIPEVGGILKKELTLTATYDVQNGKVEDMKFVTTDSNISDPGMQRMLKERDKQKTAVKMVQAS